LRTIGTIAFIVGLNISVFSPTGCCGIVEKVTDIGGLLGGEEEDDSDIPDIPFTDKDDAARALEKDAKEMEELANEYERIKADPNLSEAERERRLAEIERKMEKKGEEMGKKAEELGFDVD
jgi:hypothetical protein